MSLSDWNLEASEDAGQQEELRRQKAERMAEDRAEESYHERIMSAERRYAEKMKEATT